jgi:hypothetical protein
MKKLPSLLGAGILAMSLSTLTPAKATVIDTSGIEAGNVLTFGPTTIATFGQTFTVTGADNFLDSFSLYLRTNDIITSSPSFTGLPLDLRGYIADWDGTKASNILFESTTQTMNGPGDLLEFAFDPDLNLVSGNTYVAFLSLSNLPEQADTFFAIPMSSISIADDQIPGSFVFVQNGTNFDALTTDPWRDNLAPRDTWFKAALTGPTSCNVRIGGCDAPGAVPEPMTLSLLGAGLAGIGLVRRRTRHAGA